MNLLARHSPCSVLQFLLTAGIAAAHAGSLNSGLALSLGCLLPVASSATVADHVISPTLRPTKSPTPTFTVVVPGTEHISNEARGTGHRPRFYRWMVFTRQASVLWNMMWPSFFQQAPPEAGSIDRDGAFGFDSKWRNLTGLAKRDQMIDTYGKCVNDMQLTGLYPSWATQTNHVSKEDSLELIKGPGPCWGSMDRLQERGVCNHPHIAAADATKTSTKVECVDGEDYLSFQAFGTSYTETRCALKAMVRIERCKPDLAAQCNCTQGLLKYDVKISQIPDHLVADLEKQSEAAKTFNAECGIADGPSNNDKYKTLGSAHKTPEILEKTPFSWDNTRWWCRCREGLCKERLNIHTSGVGHVECNDDTCGEFDQSAMDALFDTAQQSQCQGWFAKANTFVSAFLSARFRSNEVTKSAVANQKCGA